MTVFNILVTVVLLGLGLILLVGGLIEVCTGKSDALIPALIGMVMVTFWANLMGFIPLI